MTGNPDDDLRALRQQLPVPPDRDFLPGRQHLREDHLMSSWTSMNSQNRRSQPRRLAARIATSVAVSAVAVGAFAAVATHDTHSAAGPAVAKSSAPADDTVAGAQISTVAYTLTRLADHSVHIVVHPSATVHPAEFEADLAKFGIHATATTETNDQVKHLEVHVGDVMGFAIRQPNGDYDTSVFPGHTQLIKFGITDPEHDFILLIKPVS
ncbi:hypothetical protein [Catenulispora rubra]|uniref:hypothetical protein n=1 Tax=Catenulispora rubra TaxID=280293 RepID=UPI0018921525|nr:hypothetical protein [Catenulispora rubra]